jgi:DNA-binding response OmpR family regulator
MKRILLVAEDQLVATYHRAKLESMGITVDTVRSTETARRAARDRNPDLTLVDPIMSGFSPIEAVEVLRAALGEREIWVVSHLPHPVATAIEKAGANRVSGRGNSLDGDLFGHVAVSLGMPPADGINPEGDQEMWVRSVCEAAPETINSLRMALHEFVKDPRNGVGLYELFCKAHQLSVRVQMLGLKPMGCLTSSVEALIYDLYAMPEQINPSIVRTVSQAIDFMAVLFEEKHFQRLQDPAAADVFVVDDEPPARQMISAAMKLVNVKITCADEAEMALSVLGDNQFDLIFLDVNMPLLSGFELCTSIRQLEDHRKTPIVFLTGMNTFQNRAQGSLSGGNDFIGKPFNLLELGVKALMWIFKGQLASG